MELYSNQHCKRLLWMQWAKNQREKNRHRETNCKVVAIVQVSEEDDLDQDGKGTLEINCRISWQIGDWRGLNKPLSQQTLIKSQWHITINIYLVITSVSWLSVLGSASSCATCLSYSELLYSFTYHMVGFCYFCCYCCSQCYPLSFH